MQRGRGGQGIRPQTGGGFGPKPQPAAGGSSVGCYVNYYKMQSQNHKEIHLYKIDWGQLYSEPDWLKRRAFSRMRGTLEKIFGGEKSYFMCENYLLTMNNAG